jgi:hypothetical protein
VVRPGEGHRHCKDHCAGCGCHFTSLAAFDLHRTGSFQKVRRCRPPGSIVRKSEPALVVAEPHGSCEMYAVREVDVEIWGVV